MYSKRRFRDYIYHLNWIYSIHIIPTYFEQSYHRRCPTSPPSSALSSLVCHHVWNSSEQRWKAKWNLPYSLQLFYITSDVLCITLLVVEKPTFTIAVRTLTFSKIRFCPTKPPFHHFYVTLWPTPPYPQTLLQPNDNSLRLDILE